MSADQVTALVATLERLRGAGLIRTRWRINFRTIKIAAGWEFEAKPGTERTATLAANGTPAPLPDILKLLPAGYKYNGERIVQWDTPIPPPEGHQMVAKMVSAFKEATGIRSARAISARTSGSWSCIRRSMSHVSRAKMTALKPTIVYSARQDANEVSSTTTRCGLPNCS